MRSRRRREVWQPPGLISKADYSVIAFVTFLAFGIIELATIPPTTHVRLVDMPVRGPLESSLLDFNEIEHSASARNTHLLAPQRSGAIEWNGEAVTLVELRQLAIRGLYEEIEPQIVFIPDADASYGLSAKAINIVMSAGVTKFCFGGLANHRQFGSETPSYRLGLSLLLPPNIEVPPPLGEPMQCSMPEKRTARG